MRKEIVLKKKLRKITIAFIDASNIIYSASRNSWKVDFEKLAKYLKERYKVKRLIYFAGVDAENLKQLKFYEKIQGFGYELRLIPVKTFADGHKKADVDSRMTSEMMLYWRKYSKAVVMAGDGDYYWVLEYMCAKKKQIKLIACANTTARELKRLFGPRFTDLNLLKRILRRKQK